MSYNAQVQQLHNYFAQHDYSLGIRRMLDAVMDTRDLTLYQEAIDFCNAYYSIKDNIPESAYKPLLEKLNVLPQNTSMTNNATALEAKQLWKRYGKSGFELKDINVALERGKIMGLVGENGNGKTTLLRLLLGELKQDQGTIIYNFHLKERDTYGLKTTIAFIPQRIPKWQGTLIDNLQYAASYYGLKGKENELWVQLIVARLGLIPYQHLTWNRLSSGYRTRFEIARTLLRRPEVLLLDEPLANLDIISQQTILQDLKFIAQSARHPMAVMLSSQQIYEVEKVSDAVLFLKQGQPIVQTQHATVTEEKAELILEIETQSTKEELQNCFNSLGNVNLDFNGGVYLATFSNAVSINNVFSAIANSNIEIIAIRNISKSARRFFNN
jgi:ABC-2 type transport system ATP-binding protein